MTTDQQEHGLKKNRQNLLMQVIVGLNLVFKIQSCTFHQQSSKEEV